MLLSLTVRLGRGPLWGVHLLALALLLHAVEAVADEPEEAPGARWRDRPLAVHGSVGLGTPLGLIGASAEYSAWEWFALEGGAGLGLAGPQGALSLRVRRPWTSLALYGSLGSSVGEFRVGHAFCLPDSSCNYEHVFVVWMNADAGLELRAASGFVFRAFLGAGIVLNRASFREQSEGLSDNLADGLWLPYLGASFGYAFPR